MTWLFLAEKSSLITKPSALLSGSSVLSSGSSNTVVDQTFELEIGIGFL